MASDLMLICEARNENWHTVGQQSRIPTTELDTCVFIGQASGGECYEDLGALFIGRLEFKRIDTELIDTVKRWLACDCIGKHPQIRPDKIIEWLTNHIGENLEIENW